MRNTARGSDGEVRLCLVVGKLAGDPFEEQSQPVFFTERAGPARCFERDRVPVVPNAGWWGAYGWVVEFRVLGPIEVCSDGRLVHVGGVKQRSILALLIASRGLVVSADRIVDEVYGDDAAAGARRSVQTIVSLLRREFGEVIVGTGEGYVFDAPRGAVDVCRFEDGVAEGLSLVDSDPRRASSVLDEALGLWRGDPYGDVDGRGVFAAEIARLGELRFAALEARAEADLMCGRHREVVAELEALVGEYPLRERLWGWLMVALYRTGRQADALGAFQRLRAVLGEELGLEPSVELRELEEQILLQDPALDLVPATPHNLPASLTSFVGRRLDLIEVGAVLTESRLVTLTGAGGSGKTRLAVECARRLLDDYPDGVWFVSLLDVDANGVESLIASTLGVVTAGDRPLAAQLVDALSPRRLLLVLDNCEHVLDAVSPFVDRLMRLDGRVTVLATSREPLGIPGESTMKVHPLRVPDVAGIEQLARSDAAVLFAERAANAEPGFAFEEHVDAVFEICHRLDGLPLALELAAGRLRVFSAEEVAGRLDDQLATLRSKQRTGDLRHATIEATIAWSWGLLDDLERTLLRRLSVFRATWAMEAAEAICGHDPINQDQIADLVARLVGKSLVVVNGVSAGSTRYRVLEPIRQYAARRLDDQATAEMRGRCIDYWSAVMAGANDPSARITLRDYEHANTLGADRANLTAAIEWALASQRYEDAIVIFASPFGELLMMRGSSFDLASRVMDTALEHRETVSHQVLIWAIEIMCVIASTDSRNQAWLHYATCGREISQSSEERQWFELTAAFATNRLGRHDAAAAMIDRIVADADAPGIRASALLGKTEYVAPQQSWELCEAALELSPIDALGWWDEGVAAWLVCIAAVDTGRYDVAIRMGERSVDRCRRIGWSMMEWHSAALLARIYVMVGRLEDARRVVDEALHGVRRIVGPNITKFSVLRRAADIARINGDLAMACGYVEEARLAAERDDLLAYGTWATAHQSALIERDDHNLERARELLDVLPHSWEGPSPEHDAGAPPEVCLAEAGVELRRNDPKRALGDLRSVFGVPSNLSHMDALLAVDLTAIALAQQGRARQAAHLFGAIDHERERTGLVIEPSDGPLREAALRDAQSNLGPVWAGALAEGRTMTLDEAFVHAAAAAGSGEGTPDAAPHTPTGAVASS